MSDNILIAVTGGIGSGKSVISRILRITGYPVFDCDSEAKKLMDNSDDILRRISEEIDSSVVIGGIIDRARLADIVFNNADKLSRLNAIVHEAVFNRLHEWCIEYAGTKFVETAILYSSGLNRFVDAEWRIVAPEEVRIQRVMKRNNLTRNEVIARIQSQNTEPCAPEPPLTVIVNNDLEAVLPQVRKALLSFG